MNRFQRIASHPASFWCAVAFIILATAGVVTDLYLVLVLKQQSISLRIWDAEDAHVTIRCAIVIFGIFIGYIVKKYWQLILFTGILVGHLALNV